MEEKKMSYGSDYTFIPTTSVDDGVGTEVVGDLYCYNVNIVNIVLVGEPNEKDFVLIDAGMPRCANEIISTTEERFGKGSKPKSIILTHGHFDHVGSLLELMDHWEDVPIYAHEAELPFLTGKSSYPEPDPTVEGGMLAKVSAIFPNEPIDLQDNVKALPEDKTVPGMPGFQWIHTPGHTPGHVSLFRESDRALIAGDAFTTVKQENLYSVLVQRLEISGPPRYFTPDWDAAWESVKKLEALKAQTAITGHGYPMTGDLLSASLKELSEQFDKIAIPSYGKYVDGKYKH